jgi:hypothetical protein
MSWFIVVASSLFVVPAAFCVAGFAIGSLTTLLFMFLIICFGVMALFSMLFPATVFISCFGMAAGSLLGFVILREFLLSVVPE